MIRRSILLIAFFAFIMSFVAVSAPASAAPQLSLTAKVNTYRLYVRALPNAKSAKIATLKQSQIVMVIGRTANQTWVQVTTSTGVTGWTRRVFLKLSGIHSTLRNLPITG